MSHKIIPFIRCVDNAEAVAEYYISIFPDAKITKTSPIVINFEIFGQSLATLNGGPHESINPAISLSLWIKDKDLTKHIRDKLINGGKVMMEFGKYPRSDGYGRCNDRYGVSRQVMYSDKTPENKLIPSLMFTGINAGKAEEAMSFYTNLFPASKIDSIFRYGPGEQDKEGHIAHAEFTLVNQLFIGIDSGLSHDFNFNDGISLMVSCKDQAEVDHYWNVLTTNGGSEVQCGWCKDKYGVSRQVVPTILGHLMNDSDPAKAGRVMQAMLQMKKLDVKKLQKAYDQQ